MRLNNHDHIHDSSFDTNMLVQDSWKRPPPAWESTSMMDRTRNQNQDMILDQDQGGYPPPHKQQRPDGSEY